VRHKDHSFDIPIDPAAFNLPRTAAGRQNEHIAHFVCSWLSLLLDSPLGTKPVKVFREFLAELYRDFQGVVIQYSELSHRLVSQTMLTGSGTLIGDWIDDFRETPLFFEYHRLFQSGDLSLLRYIYTFLNFGKKLEFVDEHLKEVAFRDWVQIEEDLSNLEFVNDDVASLRTIMSELLTPLSDEEFWPKHGPGSVAQSGVRDPIMKHNLVSYDEILDRVFFSGLFSSFGLKAERGYHPSKVLPNIEEWLPSKLVRRQHARLMFVPKNLKTARSVCMEPANLMFFQQGVDRQMRAVIEKTPFGRFIKLRDQSRNQRLGVIGSYTGDVDTIDLSAASDRASWKLVKAVFPVNWVIAMHATRSSLVDTPDGSTRALQKFAPMGSALCFPTQCIIFASVCLYATYLWAKDLLPTASRAMLSQDVYDALRIISQDYEGYHGTRKRAQPLAVYGDDICCDYRITPYVMAILGRLGFSVNINKSFTNVQAFRETCGMFSVNGVDITPLYYRVKGNSRKLNASFLSSQIRLTNEAWRRGYKNLYRSCLRRLAKGMHGIPFVRDTSDNFGIYCANPRNKHLRKRNNLNYQRAEYRVRSIAPEGFHMADFRHERYLHMRWLSEEKRDEAGLPESSDHNFRNGHKIQWVWTPLY
jgi:hypothetical protein